MGKAVFKEKIGVMLQFLFAVFFCGDIQFLFYLLKISESGELSSFIEASFLFNCAKKGYGKGSIVEIGSFKGKTTISLALGSKLKKRGKVYSIDPQEDMGIRQIFLDNIYRAKVNDYVITNFKKSEEAGAGFKSPIRLLFIDGCHEYEAVKQDILLWKDYLIEGGIIAMHDYFPDNYPAYLAGVNKAVNECIVNSPDFILEGRIDSILFASKKRSENKRIFSHFNKVHKVKNIFKYWLDKNRFNF